MSDLPDATVLNPQHDTFQNDASQFSEKNLLLGNEQPTSASSNQRLAFVDKGLADIDTLIQGLENTRVVLIDSQEDGIERITSELAQYQNIGDNNLREVHIFSHGDRGTLQLGNATFNSATAARYDDNFQQWQQFLSEDADLLFYGCNFAATDEGIALVERIARLSGADVAASNDLTGIGGDWQLEVARGAIESEVALGASAQSAYGGTLALLNNGDFESGLADWSSFTGTETVSETESFSGDRSLQLSAAASGVNQFLSVTTGETYTLTGAAKSSSGGYSAFGLNFFDADYNFLDGGDLRVTTNNWQTYQLEKAAPDGAQFVQVWAYKNDGDGEFFVDGLVLDTDGSTPPPPPPPPPTAGEELLDNSGFESNLSSWGSFTGTESVSTTDAFAGGAALQMSAAGSGVGQFVSATPGEDYVLSGYGKSSSTDYAGFGLNFFDGNYNSLGGSVSAQVLSGDWQLYERSSTAPAGTVFAQVWTYRSGAQGDVLFDQLSLKRDGAAPPSDTTAPLV